MGRVVILEGPDGGGKTTLAHALVKRGFVYRHEGPPPEGVDLIAHYLEILNESIESPVDTVHDRLWLGERIYGPIARGVDRIGDEGEKLFMRLHRSKKILHYLCMPEYKVVRENYSNKIQQSDDYLKSMDKWDKVVEGYSNWAEKTYDTSKILDYRNAALENVMCDIAQDGRIFLPKGTIGSRSAKYLFIGDIPNHPRIDVPFFAITGSSGYLNKALQLAGFLERDIALSNAYGPEGVPHSQLEILENLPNLKRIFIMGNKAKEWFWRRAILCSSDRSKVSQFPHPSFLKRFHGNNPEILAQILVQMIRESV
jgi:hypothetical protein